MIQPLRIVHRRIFLVLCGLLPLILAVGLAARHKAIRVRHEGTPIPRETLDRVNATWENDLLAGEFYSDSSHSIKVWLTATSALRNPEPDLLIYWSESLLNDEEGLSHASLLGKFVDGHAYSLPQKKDGRLILYSLAHRRIVDRAKIEGLP